MIRFMGASACALTLLLLTSCIGATIGETPDAKFVSPHGSKGAASVTIEKHRDRFVHCGRDSVTIQTGTTQHLELKFTVSEEGSVAKADIVQMSAPDPDLYSCVLHVLKGLEFPKPKSGKPAQVSYPLILKSQ